MKETLHSVGEDNIFIRSEQSAGNTTSWLSAPIIYLIAQEGFHLCM